jgi:hypothetical protein
LSAEDAVVSDFLRGCVRRGHAAIFSFMVGFMPSMPMLGIINRSGWR